MQNLQYILWLEWFLLTCAIFQHRFPNLMKIRIKWKWERFIFPIKTTYFVSLFKIFFVCVYGIGLYLLFAINNSIGMSGF